MRHSVARTATSTRLLAVGGFAGDGYNWPSCGAGCRSCWRKAGSGSSQRPLRPHQVRLCSGQLATPLRWKGEFEPIGFPFQSGRWTL